MRPANGWTKSLHTGLSLRAEKNMDVRGVEVLNEYGLEGAAEDNEDGIKKERVNGKEYYTRVMYLSSATSTWIDDYKTKVYSTDAPQGTIFVAENNSPLETVQKHGATCYKVDTSKNRSTTLNSNGSEYYGAFKVCIPVDTAAAEGSFTIKATGSVAQFNLYLAYNTAASEQSYIISAPAIPPLEAQIPFKVERHGGTRHRQPTSGEGRGGRRSPGGGRVYPDRRQGHQRQRHHRPQRTDHLE